MLRMAKYNFSKFLQLYRSTDLQEEKNRLSAALAGVTNQELIQATLEFALSVSVADVLLLQQTSKLTRCRREFMHTSKCFLLYRCILGRISLVCGVDTSPLTTICYHTTHYQSPHFLLGHYPIILPLCDARASWMTL